MLCWRRAEIVVSTGRRWTKKDKIDSLNNSACSLGADWNVSKGCEVHSPSVTKRMVQPTTVVIPDSDDRNAWSVLARHMLRQTKRKPHRMIAYCTLQIMNCNSNQTTECGWTVEYGALADRTELLQNSSMMYLFKRMLRNISVPLVMRAFFKSIPGCIISEQYMKEIHN
jgi:hypothetical protein